MKLIAVRSILLVVAAALGAVVVAEAPLAGAVAGGLVGLLTLGLERALASAPLRAVVGGGLGLTLGLLAALLAAATLRPALPAAEWPGRAVPVLLAVGLAWLGAALGARRGFHLELRGFQRAAPRPAAGQTTIKVMDTSVIIDGRIADVIAAGFIDGVLLVPQFVLRELQQVADSSDPLKRNRGRKGLDILKQVQESDRVRVEVSDRDYAELRDVDAKLLALAEELGAKILTNDYNLNKVAQLRGVPVLNVNDLANAMKPVVLPGEALEIQVIKEGKERNQGVGYLDDGTMVVVDNGKRLIGQKVEVVVTSVIQTNAGKMIFCQTEIPEIERPRVVRRTPEPLPSARGGQG